MRLRRFLSVLAACGLIACDESSPSSPPPGGSMGADARASDATSAPVDAMTAVDSGASLDASTAPDVGSTPDADPSPADIGPTADTGPTTDAGAENDAGFSFDVGPPADAGMGVDAGFGNTSCNPMFGQAEACNSNPVGAWVYQSGCLDDTVFAPLLNNCPGATRTNVAQTTTGNFELTTLGAYTRTVMDDITGDVDIPAVCAQVSGGCPGIEAAISQVIPGTTSTCTVNTSQGCNCAVRIRQTINDTGTWTVTGAGLVTLNATGGGSFQYHYCMDTNVLKYKGLSTNPTDNAVGYVLTRR